MIHILNYKAIGYFIETIFTILSLFAACVAIFNFIKCGL